MEWKESMDVVGVEFDACMPLSAMRKLQQSGKLSLPSRQFSFGSSYNTRVSCGFNWVRHAWTLHFIFSVFILYLGCQNNQERKYILVKPDDKTLGCVKAFINVMAASAEDQDAIICATHEQSRLHESVEMPEYLPFARRLSRFPDACLLPLFPVIIRALVMLSQYFKRRRQSLADNICNCEGHRTTLKRLGLYFFLMNVRIWILYVLFNVIESKLVKKFEVEESCWYDEWLSEGQAKCYGRTFDFSDHAVLYFAQILPIALIEVLHSFIIPFWFIPSRESLSLISTSPSPQQQQQLAQQQTPMQQEPYAYVAMALLLGLAYLYAITFIGAYKTASYFHTPGEVFTGYFVTLLVQIPLCYMQCSSRWEIAREFFFGYPS